MKQEQTVILFDMDGTLTEPRQKIKKPTIMALRELAKYADLGIISGSGLDYITQQCNEMFDMGCVPISSVQLLPCNGTKHLVWKGSAYESMHNANMLTEIGKTNYRKILSQVFECQALLCKLYPDLPYSGTFFHYRGSLLNWCPIGRAATNEQRDEWKKWDEDYHIREIYFDELKKFISSANIPVTVALGGSTSFDIYPNGWDKTYGLKHFPGADIYFVGDRCDEGGNDKHIYDELAKLGRAWKTTGPEETVKIINEIIKLVSAEKIP